MEACRSHSLFVIPYLLHLSAGGVQSLTSWVEHNLLPFCALFAVHLFIRNFYSFLQFSLLLISTASSTLHLQAFVATPPEHKLQKSRDVLILVSLNIWALSLLGLPDGHVWRAVFFQLPSETYTVWRRAVLLERCLAMQN